MDKFLVRKKKAKNLESEAQHVFSQKVKRQKVQTYDEEYIKLGFVGGPSDITKPHCIVCYKTLSNKSMKPAKLKRHLMTQHPELTEKPPSFFKRKKKESLKQKKTFSKSLVSNEKLMKASYLVALRVARAKKPHTIAENLIFPAAIDMCEAVLDGKCATKLKEILLSNNTVSRRVDEILNDIKAQLLERLKQTYFAIQLDESTDIAGQAQLLVYVRYCWGEKMIKDFMFCYEMQCRTTGLDVFNVFCDFFSQSELSWDRCVGICTDGAALMTGKHSGAVARIRERVPNIIQTHCMIHREVLAAKHLGQSLCDVLSSCVKIVNSIKARPLHS